MPTPFILAQSHLSGDVMFVGSKEVGTRAGLVSRPLPPTPTCQCHLAGYCPRHGTYTPAVVDPEVLEALGMPALSTGGGIRIIRKGHVG